MMWMRYVRMYILSTCTPSSIAVLSIWAMTGQRQEPGYVAEYDSQAKTTCLWHFAFHSQKSMGTNAS
jgi:hypothetical protein